MKKLKISEDAIREIILIAGFFLFGFGLWLIYQPAAFIVCGALLMWVGLPPRRRKGGD